MAKPQSPLAAKAEPPLKPVHPSHKIPPPRITNGRFAGKLSARCLRAPSSDARAKAEVPELMWTTVPPAKSWHVKLAANKMSRGRTQTHSMTPSASGTGKVLGAHFSDPSATPDPVAQRHVNGQDPGNDEDGIGRKSDALDHGSRNDGRCNDGKPRITNPPKLKMPPKTSRRHDTKCASH